MSQFTVMNDSMNDKKGHNIVNDIEQLCYSNACSLHVSTDIKYVYLPTRLAISCKAIVFHPLTVLNESDLPRGP